MATASDVLRIASAEVGYYRHNDPQTGTKYGRWYASYTGSSYYGQNGVPFCAMFASWCFAQAGASCPGLPESYVPYIYNKAKRQGAILSSKKSAQPGDLVLFDWNNDGSLNHVGIVEKNLGGSLQTIEGNSPAGYVSRKSRPWTNVAYIVRPTFTGGGSTSTSTDGSALGDVEWFGPKFARELIRQTTGGTDDYLSGQSVLNEENFWAVSGGVRYDGGGSDAIRYLQGKLGVSADGYYGANSIKAHQRWLKGLGYYTGEVDGYHGKQTNVAMSKALTNGDYKKL